MTTSDSVTAPVNVLAQDAMGPTWDQLLSQCRFVNDGPRSFTIRYGSSTQSIDDEVKFLHFAMDDVRALFTDGKGNIFPANAGVIDADIIAVYRDEPLDNALPEEQAIIEELRIRGRPILAERLLAMLSEMEEDEPPIRIVSLKDLARYILEYRDFADPSVSPGGDGIVHAEWSIEGNGLVVIGFLGQQEIVFVAQADACSNREKLSVSVRGIAHDVLKEHGHLVPSRR
jgi:hypothetical protein